MRGARMNQRERHEAMQKNGQPGGFYVELFGPDGKNVVASTQFTTKEEAARIGEVVFEIMGGDGKHDDD